MSKNTDQYHSLPAEGFVRLDTILKVFPVSKAQWWKGVKQGIYPKGVSPSHRITFWKVEDIRALLTATSQAGK